MSGDRLIKPCPQCGDPNCEADTVDIGVGSMQSGPFGCERCGYVEKRPTLAELGMIDDDGAATNFDDCDCGEDTCCCGGR
jgi:hypothetical protein